MPVTVDVVDPGAREAWLDAVYDEFATLDAIFSPFRVDSAVCRINRGELPLADAGTLVGQVVDLCRHYHRATNGYFSAWRGGRFDPTGLVKGWALDRAASILVRHGCRNFLVDAGGDVQVRGVRADGGPWRVGVRHPVQRDRVVRVILAQDLAVATSGTYEKGEHIDDPHTLRPVTELISFTVIGPDILQADVYATAGFAMGVRGLGFIEAIPGYEAYAIEPGLTGSWTAGFDRYCVPVGGGEES